MKSLSQSRQLSSQHLQANDRSSRKGIKIKGIVYVENGSETGSSHNEMIEIKSNQKLLLHSYKRFKTFTYNFDYVYQKSTQSGFYDCNFSQFNSVQAINAGLDYMLFCTGTAIKNSKQIPTIEMLFYQQLVAVYEKYCHKNLYYFQFFMLAACEDNIVDLVSGRTVDVRESAGNNKYCQLTFSDCQKLSPETPYQILQSMKITLNKRKKNFPHSYYIIYVQALPEAESKLKKQRLLFINATKDCGQSDKNWDNKNNLILNKCILALLNKMQGGNKQTYAPFRDSKVTRIMKPFLTFNAKVDVIGFVNPQNQQISYHTLNMVSNLSNISIPSSKNSQNPENPEIQQKIVKINSNTKTSKLNKKYKTEQIAQIKPQPKQKMGPNTNINIDTQTKGNQKKPKRVDLFEQMRINFDQQAKVQKKLQQIRGQIKLVKKRKQISGLKLFNQDQLELSQILESQEIDFQLNKEKQLLKQSQKLERYRMETIQKAVTVTQKLKLLKQYYTMAMQNQKQQAKQFMSNQQMMNKFYQKNITTIDKQLKKSPMQLLNRQKKSIVVKSEKISKKNDSMQNINLPEIYKAKKRLSLLKEKVKKGRVEYSSFLSKNISQYQSYAADDDQ